MSLAGSSDELRDFRLNNNLISRLCLPPSLSLSLSSSLSERSPAASRNVALESAPRMQRANAR